MTKVKTETQVHDVFSFLVPLSVSVCLCMYMYACVLVWIVYVCVLVFMLVCVCTYLCIHVHVTTHTHTDTRLRSRTCAVSHICMRYYFFARVGVSCKIFLCFLLLVSSHGSMNMAAPCFPFVAVEDEGVASSAGQSNKRPEDQEQGGDFDAFM